MSSKSINLGEVLGDDSCFDAKHFLYLPMDEVWQLATNCAVLDKSDVDGIPEVALKCGLSYALGIATVQEVVANARWQFADATPKQLLQAFLFYYDNDAFIVFKEQS